MEQLEDLDYADDITLVSRHWNQLRRKLDRIKQHGDQVGLRINSAKTKSMCVNVTEERRFNMEGEGIEEVDKFTYLGSEVTKGGETAEDIRKRCGKACAAYYKLNKAWKG